MTLDKAFLLIYISFSMIILLVCYVSWLNNKLNILRKAVGNAQFIINILVQKHKLDLELKLKKSVQDREQKEKN